MSEAMRKKFQLLISEVENLEDQVEAVQAKGLAADDRGLLDLQEKLAAAREELARVSDGCGHGHHAH